MKDTASEKTGRPPPNNAIRPCYDFCCSIFANVEVDAITHLPQLSNAIHPIFRKENFNANIDYATLEPSLRLASRLIESDPLVSYINALFDGEIRDCSDGGVYSSPSKVPFNRQGRPLSVWPKPGKDRVNRASKRRRSNVLRQMVDMVAFHVKKPSTDAVNGQCFVQGSNLSSQQSRLFPLGCKSKVVIHQRLYDTLIAANKSGDATKIIHAQFQFVRTLNHELSHALHNAAFGRWRPRLQQELLYKNSKASEAGFELEMQLFGGIFIPFGGRNTVMNGQTYTWACGTGRRRSPALTFHLMEWPSPSMITRYKREMGMQIGFGKELRSCDVVWTVPNSFVASMFTDEFWREMQKTSGKGSLRAPRISSWPFGLGERSGHKIFDQHIAKVEQNAQQDVEREESKATRLDFLPLTFDAVEDAFGPRRARKLCSSMELPLEQRPKGMCDDWTDYMSEWCLAWFEEPQEYYLNRRQRKRGRQKAKRARDREEYDRTQIW